MQGQPLHLWLLPRSSKSLPQNPMNGVVASLEKINPLFTHGVDEPTFPSDPAGPCAGGRMLQ